MSGTRQCLVFKERNNAGLQNLTQIPTINILRSDVAPGEVASTPDSVIFGNYEISALPTDFTLVLWINPDETQTLAMVMTKNLVNHESRNRIHSHLINVNTPQGNHEGYVLLLPFIEFNIKFNDNHQIITNGQSCRTGELSLAQEYFCILGNMSIQYTPSFGIVPPPFNMNNMEGEVSFRTAFILFIRRFLEMNFQIVNDDYSEGDGDMDSVEDSVDEYSMADYDEVYTVDDYDDEYSMEDYDDEDPMDDHFDSPEEDDYPTNTTPQHQYTMEYRSSEGISTDEVVVQDSFLDTTEKIRLPTIELPKFSGNLIDWLTFWAQFEKIHLDIRLKDSDKFYYLLQSLSVDTEAYKIVSNYPLTEENYSKAIDALRRRYANPDLLLQVYVRELLKLVIDSASGKKKLSFHELYYKIQSYLGVFFKNLNLESASPDTWLYPLVELCLSDELLLAWKRRSQFIKLDVEHQTRLDQLMDFLEREILIQQNIQLAKGCFQIAETSDQERKKGFYKKKNDIPTVTGLQQTELGGCIFCEKKHASQNCFAAKKMSLEEKRKVIREKKVCFKCLKGRHLARYCRTRVRCYNCGSSHFLIMCTRGDRNNKEAAQLGIEPELTNQNSERVKQRVSHRENFESFDATVKPNEDLKKHNDCSNHVCQRNVALQTLMLNVIAPKGRKLLKADDENFVCKVTVRDQSKICQALPRIPKTSLISRELEQRKIKVTDLGNDNPPIELLIGADIYGKLMTGKTLQLDCGLTAMLTHFVMSMNTMFGDSRQDFSISQLWDLDTIGVRDPVEVKSSVEQETAFKNEFLKNISRNKDGRYVVPLPWIEVSTTRKLKTSSKYDEYDCLFKEWEREGLIENVNNAKPTEIVHYLPHRPVYKEGASTPVRPVFDASCKIDKHPSLNDCLWTGSNCVKKIMELLMRFREKRIGFTADIRRAFQTIKVREEDRDAMRFLWWQNQYENQVQVYRHTRVMFGATYNSVGSEDSLESYSAFKEKSIQLLRDAKMDLRIWQSNAEEFQHDTEAITMILGVRWDRRRDLLFIDTSKIDLPSEVTKRTILSTVQSIFDPFGILGPALIPTKSLLQRTWIQKIKWDTPIQWRFDPPFAAWWGGWWKRLIRSMKNYRTVSRKGWHCSCCQIKDRRRDCNKTCTTSLPNGVGFFGRNFESIPR
ncbi:hypothetical protein LAZ67_21000672 [Cordylochernes scorpioides]|uniref:CCHC-type domain-containing protein n=1 Tax=Cordylochernes scorpioides TaxID=51811 RepID=A0ABY6LLX4_9ARAC|nr:hypothetical protein LAZ67_21000672 [Cordylochernes scorpioides]